MTFRFVRRRSEASRGTLLRQAAQDLCFAAGWVALAYCGLEYLQAAIYQASQLSQLDSYPSAVNSPHMHEAIVAAVRSTVANGSSFGRIDIPRIGISSAVVEGVSERNLRLAVGHLPGTAFPGDKGNVAIAGHRDTFFRALRKVRTGDAVTVTTLYGTYRYSVKATHIVKPDDVSVLSDSKEPVLTLITCYPFYYLGPAPQRFVVYAREISLADPGELAPGGAVSLVRAASREAPVDPLFGLRGWFEKPRAGRLSAHRTE
jgi:sortase A